VYPAEIVKDLTVIVALIVEALFALAPTPSKKTSSVEVGTEALFAPPLVADQFVFPVASQFEVSPPPTQYRLAQKAQEEKRIKKSVSSLFIVKLFIAPIGK
jgi:hypothetical protein